MKRTLSIILITVILLSYCAIQPKAYTSVEIAYGLNLLRGTGEGLDEAYLSMTPMRTNAAMIILRLLGLENDALEHEKISTFSDASSATAYWQPILAYLYDNPDVGFSGYGDDTFRPNESINSQMLAKVLLTVLGYKQDVDFSWAETLKFADSIGLKSLVNKSTITNNDVAIALVEALSIKTKGGYTFVTELVVADIINIDQAEKYGFTVETTQVEIKNAKATGVKTITVEFLMPIPKNSTVMLRKDFIGISNTYTLSENRRILTINTTATMTPGQYTVAVAGSVATFEVFNEKASSLVISTERIYKDVQQNIGLKLLNQYGEEMPITNVNISVTNKTSGSRKITVTKIDNEVYLDVSYANLADQIYIYALDNSTLLNDSALLTVQSVPSIKKISILGVEASSDTNRIYEDTSSHIIKIQAYDQYGQKYFIRQSDIDKKNLLLISSNNLCISPSNIKADINGNLVFSTNMAGEVLINIIVSAEGISASTTIAVYAAPVLSSIKVDQLPSTIFKNERVEVGVIAYDQYGSIYEIKPTDIIGYTTTDPMIVPAASISVNRGVLSFNTLNSGEVSVNSRINNSLMPLFTIKVNDGNVPYSITSLDIPFSHFEKGIENIQIPLSNIKVVDQYGNPNSLNERPVWDTVEWGIYIDKVSGNSFLYENGVFSTTNTVGTDVFNVYITRDGRIMDRSGYSFMLTNVSASEIQVFDIDIPKIIYGGANNRIEAHTKYITIKGYTLSKKPVMLKTDDLGMPTLISAITVSNSKVYIDTSTWAIKFNTYFEDNDIVTVKFWKDGMEIESEDIVITSAESKVSRIEYDQAQSFIISSSEFYTEPLKIYDQYDIETNLPQNTQWVTNSNLIDSVTFDPLTKRLRVVIKGSVISETEVIISYIPSDGLFSFRGFYTIMPGRY